ncbi:MAG TPA: capsule assembly Wzi family protein [Terracidiphilus sp.]|nr:capsule assembly Wzi family protein [Terracidiphilus sp.]
MIVRGRRIFAAVLFVAGMLPLAVTAQAGSADEQDDACDAQVRGSAYLPVDSWIYPAVLRLHSLGYLDTVFVGMRPWTRGSVEQMLKEVGDRLQAAPDSAVADEARSIYKALVYELRAKPDEECAPRDGYVHLESAYTVARGLSGTPLHDSYHLGSTVVNDYGRPYENGLNSYSGASGYASAGRYVLYVRGEFEGAPSATGYSSTLAGQLAAIDGTTYFLNTTTPIPYNQQATIPAGPLGSVAKGRIVEAYASARVLNHEVSFGKQDEWLGPGLGGGMAYSNNAENIYSFRINRVDPLAIPFLSRLVGPFRYDFIVGSLKGHVYPNDPWMHLEQLSFKPSENLELGFERTVIWGGKNHEPITLHTFLRSFFSVLNTTSAVKNSAQDPGARFSAFYFSYRLPFVRNWLTLYSDAEAHDDVSPASAPRRAAFRPGLYLSHMPGLAKLDVRAEAVTTDPPTSRSNGGQFNYYEAIQKQGFTNQGQIMGDWIGREAKGGQAWITYHLSGNEWAQVSVRNQKTPKDFIPGGTTLNDVSLRVVKRLGKDLELDGSFAYERWKAPIYMPGEQTVTNTAVRLTWFPERKLR